MTLKRVLRRFSLYDNNIRRGGRKGRQGGKSKFREFLAKVGHTVRPLLRDAEKVLINKGKEKLAKRIGSSAVNFGTSLMSNLV